MAWTAEFSPTGEQDLERIYDHLFAAYQSFGDDVEEATLKAEHRIQTLFLSGLELARTPHSGTLHPDLASGLRHIRRDRAVFWFTLDETAEKLRILAVFYGAQDHIEHIRKRLQSGGADSL